MADLQKLCHKCDQTLPHTARFCAKCGSPSPLSGVPQPALKGPPPLPPAVTPVYSPLSNLPALFALHRRSILFACGGLVLLLLTFGFFAGTSSPPGASRQYTVQEYALLQKDNIQKSLNTVPNAVSEKIENAHLTVTYKGATVKSVRATTVDGSNYVGPGGSNVSELAIVVTAYWEGKIQTDGYTEIEIVFDPQSSRIKRQRFLASNALINIETIDWVEVAVAFGSVLAGLM